MAVVAFVVAFVVGGSPALAQYGGTPELTLDRTQVNPGEIVNVTVSGCGPVGTVADVVIDGIVVGQGTIDADGGFSGPYVVPSVAQGFVDVEVRFCFNEVLSSALEVTIGTLPFIEPDVVGEQQQQGGGTADLPRTGSDGTGPLVQLAVGLIGAGALIVFLVPRLRDREDQASAGAH